MHRPQGRMRRGSERAWASGPVTKVGSSRVPWRVVGGQLENSQEEGEQHPGNDKASSHAVVLQPARGGWAGFPARLMENHPGKSWGFGQPPIFCMFVIIGVKLATS